MCGWEFPPYISGGLGTACHGLTKALSRQSVDVVFVLPRAVEIDHPLHLKLLSPPNPPAAGAGSASAPSSPGFALSAPEGQEAAFAHVQFRGVPSGLVNPYQSAGGKFHGQSSASSLSDAGSAAREHEEARTVSDSATAVAAEAAPAPPIGVLNMAAGNGPLPGYGGDLIGETARYANLCVELAKHESFDVVHAHDWMTFPAGLAVAAATGKPLIAHIHSTEFDRSGEHVNQRVYDIERRGLHGAMHVIAVSHYTKSILVHRYGLSPDKIAVVYNGIENGSATPVGERVAIGHRDKVVLFLGRITMQKGPEYFVNAARKVLEKMDNVKFVMAGVGDKVTEIIELAALSGIGHKILFTGFLHGRDVERIFKMADLYVMPSVSEPFGITPLEAISHDVPVIISRTSGVSEVLTHALKVDFWDTHEIANKIIAVLRHPPLSLTLREHADMELRRLNWDDSAARCRDIYEAAIEAMPVG